MSRGGRDVVMGKVGSDGVMKDRRGRRLYEKPGCAAGGEATPGCAFSSPSGVLRQSNSKCLQHASRSGAGEVDCECPERLWCAESGPRHSVVSLENRFYACFANVVIYLAAQFSDSHRPIPAARLTPVWNVPPSIHRRWPPPWSDVILFRMRSLPPRFCQCSRQSQPTTKTQTGLL